MPSAARIVLGGLLAAEGAAALIRFQSRKTQYALASEHARASGRQLVIVGDPDAGLHTKLVRAYGCEADAICVDINGCPQCPVSVKADLTRGPIQEIPDNSAIVFVSAVLEYVNDFDAAWREIMRMAGHPGNVHFVNVQPWTLTSVLYPGAIWWVGEGPPAKDFPAHRKIPTWARVAVGVGFGSLVLAAVRG